MKKPKILDSDAVPTGANRFQAVLAGGREDAVVLYMVADDYENDNGVTVTSHQQANAYADEIGTRLGYLNVSISDEETAIRRNEASDTGYFFRFPNLEESVVVEAPPIGDEPPPVVIVLRPENTRHLFDKGYADKRLKDERAAKRAERAAMAGPILDEKRESFRKKKG